ncbi:hypothetical protein HKX48_003434 [Thoreauomyces humboldtii]|nr:hypothetical protein HKX48_003434 [Thoreauomyces humboldtii]
MRPVIDYQIQRFRQAHADFDVKLPFPALVHYATHNRYGQFDGVLYGVLHRIKPVDLEYMKRLSGVTNLVPVLLVNNMPVADIQALKLQVLELIEKEGIKTYTFGMTIQELSKLVSTGLRGVPPFAVTTSPNLSEYDEFAELKARLLELHAADFRRHSAIKFCKWRESTIAVESATVRVRRDKQSKQRNPAWWEAFGMAAVMSSIALIVAAGVGRLYLCDPRSSRNGSM